MPLRDMLPLGAWRMGLGCSGNNILPPSSWPSSSPRGSSTFRAVDSILSPIGRVSKKTCVSQLCADAGGWQKHPADNSGDAKLPHECADNDTRARLVYAKGSVPPFSIVKPIVSNNFCFQVASALLGASWCFLGAFLGYPGASKVGPGVPWCLLGASWVLPGSPDASWVPPGSPWCLWVPPG